MYQANMFEIVNQKDLSYQYRLLAVEGLPQLDDYERNLNLIVKGLSYELRQSVALVKREGKPYVALPADSPLPILERPLTPHVAVLRPVDRIFDLDLEGLNEDTLPIAERFLAWAFQSKLMEF